MNGVQIFTLSKLYASIYLLISYNFSFLIYFMNFFKKCLLKIALTFDTIDI